MPRGNPRGFAAYQEARAAERAAEQALPHLVLHVFAHMGGVHCRAYVDRFTARRGLVRTTIAEASWRPPEVTERLVVEWGERALAAWLETPTLAGEDPQGSAAQ